jgi:uncharacterized protein YqeY
MSLLEIVKNKRTIGMKTKNEPLKNAARMILGEVPRLNKKPGQEVTDTEVIKIIKGLIKGEKLTLDYSGQESSEYLEELEKFMPQMVSADKIMEFVNCIDFTKLKSPMQAIGLVKKEFGADNVDGGTVKKLIDER